MRRSAPCRSRGQALILVALSMVLITAMLALTVDVGTSFAHRRTLQTAADAGAMAGAHLALEEVIAGIAPNYPAQRQAAIAFAKRNGATAADTITVQWVDALGDPFVNNGLGNPVVGAGTIQGMRVGIAASRATYLFRTLGFAAINVSTSAMAQFGTPNGLVGPVPLVLNYDTVPRDALLRPILYQPVLLQTSAGASGGAACCTAGQIDNAGKPIPSQFYPPATPLGPSNFHILHDPPTSYALAATATETSTHFGLTTTISLSTPYYVETNAPATNGFSQGLLDRIIDANNHPVFNGDTGTGPATFHPTNPRLFIIGINPLSTTTNCTPPCDPSVGTLQIGEFLAFYTVFVVFDTVTPANGISIGGYYVNTTGVPGSNGFGSPTATGPKVFRLTR